jgi:hypothetical protein
MSTFWEVLLSGNPVITLSSYIVIAHDDRLVAWCRVGVEWRIVAERAGGANLYKSALDTRDGAKAWFEELKWKGRL